MTMDALEVTGKSVDDAVARALAQLHLERSQIEIEVLTEGRSGLFGFGGEPARIRVRPLVPVALADEEEEPQPHTVAATPVPARPAPRPEPAPQAAPQPPRLGHLTVAPIESSLDTEPIRRATEVLSRILALMGFDATLSVRAPQTPGDGVGMATAVLDVDGDDALSVLIGRRGETLASLQYLVNLSISHRGRGQTVIGIDVQGYRRRREDALVDLARRMADQVRQTRQSFTLEPMPPAERRIVHLALAEDPDVMTVSIGEGEGRKVAITPRY